MSNPQKKYEAVHPLLELMLDASKAHEFPVELYSLAPEELNLSLLFEEAEEMGIGGKRLLFFVALSLVLYENMGVSSPWVMLLHDFFKKENLEDLYREFYANFVKQNQLTFKEPSFHFKMRTADLRRNFTAAVSSGRARWGQALAVQRDEDVDELFSRLFAPGQRAILKKMLHHEELTKTERETFSRVVKKKLLAIIDPECQRVARVLTGNGWKKQNNEDSTQPLELVRNLKRAAK